MSSKQFTPTAPELNGAIKSALDSGLTDWKDIHKTLVEGHPYWKLPERRVAKFVKRQLSGKPVGADDDSVTPSVRSGRSLRSWISTRSNRRLLTTNKENPSKEAAVPIPVPKEQKEPLPPPPVPAVKEPEPEEETKVEEVVETPAEEKLDTNAEEIEEVTAEVPVESASEVPAESATEVATEEATPEAEAAHERSQGKEAQPETGALCEGCVIL